MPSHRDNWSDSDDEDASQVQTSVLLGVPDGVVETITDIADAAVSRIGGHPAFLPSREPPLSSSQCKLCSDPSELLVQMWCPFEDSPMDRALYIWGCGRPACQGKQGSVRAWRGLRRNDAYAAKLARKLAQKRAAQHAKARAAASEAEKKNAPRSNPFSMAASSSPGTSTFDIGTHLFGDISTQPPPTLPTSSSVHQDDGNDDDDDCSESDSSASEELLTAMASVALAESPWTSAPSYPPIYLSTVSEYLPPHPKLKVPAGAKISDPLADDDKASKDISWAPELYEDSLELDHVFERFTKRVGYEGEQCVRYELDGTPLPYTFDKTFESLFPSPPAPTIHVTKSAFTIAPKLTRSYFPTSLPACPSCRSKRVFECQLMPNLINVLRRPASADLSEEERRRAVEHALKGGADAGADAGRGMEWGTCMVFSCEQDCCVDEHGAEARECWREEAVLIQAAI